MTKIHFIYFERNCYLRTLKRGRLCATCPQRMRSPLPACLRMCITSCFCADKCGDIKLEGEPEMNKRNECPFSFI